MTEDQVAEFLAVLLLADKGRIPCVMENRAAFIEDRWLDAVYRTAGWEFEIFNDAGEWDYIQKITTPEGQVIDYDDIAPAIHYWERSDSPVWDWNIK